MPRRGSALPHPGPATRRSFPRRLLFVLPVLLLPWGACGGTGSATSTPDGGRGEAGPDAGEDAGPDAGGDPVGTIVFEPPSGTFEGELRVSMSTDVAEAEIRYTTDARPPSEASPLYDGTPLSIRTTTELRARAFLGGAPAGPPGMAVYVARSFDPRGDLPIVVLDNHGAGPLDTRNREFVPAAFMSFGLEGGVASLASVPEVATRAGIHVRGQSTAYFPKTPIRVELWDGDDEDADYAVLGMPAESDWALRGPYADKALIRDPFIYDLGREMGMQAPRWAFCELYLNVESRPLGADDYMGVYIVVETIKNAKNRLDLQQLREEDVALPDITGGYIVKFEWLVEDYEEPTLECGGSPDCWAFLKVHDPIPLGAEQEAWLTAHLFDFNEVLHSPGFDDVVDGYDSFIDVDSFVDQLIINELSREMDSYIRSAYFYKDRDTEIFAGPLWDYNLVFGVGGFFQNERTAGWQYEQMRMPFCNDWFQVLLTDPAFVDRVAARWQELRRGLLSDAAIDARIEALTAPLANAADRNFERWPNLSEAQVEMFRTPTAGTWEGQVEFMRDWVVERAAWLDTQWR